MIQERGVAFGLEGGGKSGERFPQVKRSSSGAILQL